MRLLPAVFPAPASPDALALECTCPLIDNAAGKGAIVQGVDPPTTQTLGAFSDDGFPLFWTDQECPLHRLFQPETPTMRTLHKDLLPGQLPRNAQPCTCNHAKTSHQKHCHRDHTTTYTSCHLCNCTQYTAAKPTA